MVEGVLLSFSKFCEKISPGWWGGGGVHSQLLHYIYHHVQSYGVRTLLLRGQIHSLYFYSTPFLLVVPVSVD